MAENFDFLKQIDKDLFTIINDAEKLYQGEFFEQCMTQTRRFGEIICKNVLGSKRTTELTFDAMLATLKDCTLGGNLQEKEFVEDLYFLKKHGNNATHSITVKQDGIEALECLKRAFEIAINYCVYSCGASKTILKKQYDTELLITGKKSVKTLSEKYKEQKAKTTKSYRQNTKNKPQYCSVKSEKRQKSPIYWVLVGISSLISIVILFLLAII